MKTSIITITMILFGFTSTNVFAEGKDSKSSKSPSTDMGKMTTAALNSFDKEISQTADSLLDSVESSGHDSKRDEQISKDFEMTMTSMQAGKDAESIMAEFEEESK